MGELADEADHWSAAIAGDAQAFAALFDLHRDRVFRYARRLLGDIHDAEDATAGAVLELWRRRTSVRVVEGSVLPWLLVTTTLAPDKTSITITTRRTASWRLRAEYLRTEPWGVNDHGQTYEVRDKNGTPDLQAVMMAGNTGLGYVRSSDLACASGADHVHDPSEAVAWTESTQGRSVAIPAYTSNGTKVIGTFLVGSEGRGIHVVPLATIANKYCQTKATGTTPSP